MKIVTKNCVTTLAIYQRLKVVRKTFTTQRIRKNITGQEERKLIHHYYREKEFVKINKVIKCYNMEFRFLNEQLFLEKKDISNGK